jgi:hypothetical protein
MINKITPPSGFNFKATLLPCENKEYNAFKDKFEEETQDQPEHSFGIGYNYFFLNVMRKDNISDTRKMRFNKEKLTLQEVLDAYKKMLHPTGLVEKAIEISKEPNNKIADLNKQINMLQKEIQKIKKEKTDAICALGGQYKSIEIFFGEDADSSISCFTRFHDYK